MQSQQQSNPSPSQTGKLREQVRAVLEDTPYIDYGEPDTETQIAEIMQLIAHHQQQAVINELKQLLQDVGLSDTRTAALIKNRIAELSTDIDKRS